MVWACLGMHTSFIGTLGYSVLAWSACLRRPMCVSAALPMAGYPRSGAWLVGTLLKFHSLLQSTCLYPPRVRYVQWLSSSLYAFLIWQSAYQQDFVCFCLFVYLFLGVFCSPPPPFACPCDYKAADVQIACKDRTQPMRCKVSPH